MAGGGVCAENTHVSRGLWWVGQVLGPRGLLLASACQAGPSRDPGTFLQYRQAQPPCWTLFLNPLCPQGQAQTARSPPPRQSPRSSPFLPSPGPHLCCRSQSCGLLTPGWAWKALSAASCRLSTLLSLLGALLCTPWPLGTPLSLYLPAAHPLPASMSSRSWGRCPGRDVWPALSISGGLPSESNGEEGRMEGFLKEVAVTDPALHAGLQALR